MVATVECPPTAPVFAAAAEPIAGAELTAHELAIDCLRHASALWRGDAVDEAFGRWLAGYWCRALPPEPARSPDAVSPHCAGAHGIRGDDEFHAAVAGLFARPDDLVFGRETATQARERFTSAVTGVVDTHAEGNVIVVAHGTVIALFVARCAGLDPFPLWRRLGLPSFVALSLPERTVHRLVETID